MVEIRQVRPFVMWLCHTCELIKYSSVIEIHRRSSPNVHTFDILIIINHQTYNFSPSHAYTSPDRNGTPLFSTYFNIYYKESSAHNLFMFKYITIFQCSNEWFRFDFQAHKFLETKRCSFNLFQKRSNSLKQSKL